MDNTYKRHIISAAITFVATFLTTFGALLAVQAVSPETLTAGAALSMAYTAVRAALKAVSEALIGLSGDTNA